MDMVILRKLVTIARAEFESGKIPRELLADLYNLYNPNVEIGSFLDDAAKLFPVLNCGLATVYLQHVLAEGEVIQGSYDCQNHTFLKLENRIIDITADQFGGPSVYIGPLQSPWSATNSQAKLPA